MEIKKLPGAEYSPEFREQAVRTYQESGLSVAGVAKRLLLPKSELPRVLRRLKSLKRWSHEQIKQIFPGSKGTRSPYRAGTPQ